MKNYYEVHVDMVVNITKAGKEKTNREIYLVDALSVTEAEAKVVTHFNNVGVTLDYFVIGAKRSRIVEVI